MDDLRPAKPASHINVASRGGAYLSVQCWFEGDADKDDLFGGWERFRDWPYDPPADVTVVQPATNGHPARAEGLRLRRSDIARLHAALGDVLAAWAAEEGRIEEHLARHPEQRR